MSRKSKKNYRNIQMIKDKKVTSPGVKSDEFNPDYSDVIKDLRRIGILASTFFVLLIALSFIL